MSEDTPLYTIASAALKLTISQRTLEREIADGKIEIINLRGCVRIEASALANYISQSKVTRSKLYLTEGAEINASSASKLTPKTTSAILDQLLQRPTRLTKKPKPKKASLKATLDA